ncbi:MAG: VENN motif pre-toxin domain-containing protein [Snodgrassella sp.]|uniref:CdiA C-terminal domain-containing protein n=1 Tax=Snodgrassella sp. TaxID=2815304 RepID=UPI002582DC8B|nr:VENN motif pre-toxin domain-containing protein [Snodgrassella sp.]MCO6509137.1 VENN motif pre-toxin domain-containing protein [Snodgrassella sp.]
MDKQQADATATIANSVRTLSADMARKANQERQQAREKAEQELQSNNPELWQDYNQLSEDKKQLVLRETSKDYRTADEQAQSWGIGGGKSRALNAVTSAVTGILGGQTNLQAATNALAPYAAELIGKQFGHGDNQNQAAQLVAHALLGAISASVNGGNAAAGAVGASAAELAAQYLIKQLPKDQYPEAIDPRTGEIDPNRLPESVKASIRDLSSAVATVSGGLTGGSLVNAQIAGVVGQNAVENNVDLIQLISPASAAMLSKDPKHREAMKMAHQIRMMNSAITIATVGGGYVVAGIGYVAPEAIPAIYSACRVNPAGCTVVAVESTEVLAGLATGAVTVSNLPASAIKSTSKIGGKYAEEIGQIGKEASKGSAKAGKEAMGSLTGQQTKLPPNASAENIRSLQRENESAKILSKNGYHVEQNPMTSGIKNPDYKINGEIFDNYAPSSSNIRNIWREVDKKVQKGQTNSVVINLADSKATVADLQKQFKDWPIKGLNKVIVIDRSGKAVRIK